MAPPFVEEDLSEIDSISLNSTEPSDEEATYEVEKILHEDVDDEGVSRFLVKWQGYPLHRSTWEPADNFLSGNIEANWRKEKEKIENGTSVAFDLGDFEAAYQKNEDERDERVRRREAKREKLRIGRSKNGSTSRAAATDTTMRDACDDSQEDGPLRNLQKRSETSPAKKKGTAQKVKKSLNRRPVATSSSEESSEDEGDVQYSSEDSLMEEAAGRKMVPRERSSEKHVRSTAAGARSNTDSNAKTTSTASTRKESAPSKPPTRVAARKSAPSTRPMDAQLSQRKSPEDARGSQSPERPITRPATATKRKSIADAFINSNRPEATRKQRVASENDPRSFRFRNLSEQQRFHKHGQKEAPPDPSMLATYNPATGRMEPPPSAVVSTKAASTSYTAAESPTPMSPQMASASPPRAPASTAVNPRMSPREPHHMGQAPVAQMPSAFGRREVPAPERRRSISPPSPNGRICSTLSSNNPKPTHEKTKTCWDWRNGICNKPEGACWFAHFLITCPFWKKYGWCKWSDNECQYVHGEVDTPPSVGQSADSTIAEPSRMQAHNDETAKASRQDVFNGALAQMTVNQSRKFLTKKDITCRFWYNGNCKKTEAQCQFAHRDTGHYAGRPGTGTILSNLDAIGPARNQEPMAGGPAQSPSRRPSMMMPSEHDLGEPMMIDNGPGQIAMMSPGQISPASRRPSLPMPQVPIYTHDVVLAMKCGPAGFDLRAKLACSTYEDKSLLSEHMGSQDRVEIQHMINVADLKHYFGGALEHGSHLPSGNVLSERTQDSEVGQFAEMCKAQISCGIALSSEFTLLVYPAGTEEWKFLIRPGDTTSSQAALKFKLLPRLTGETSQHAGTTSDTSLQAGTSTATAETVSYILDVDVDRLLELREGQQDNRAFIMMPPDHMDELKLLTRALEGRGCRVASSVLPGAWDDWLKSKHGSSLVVLHPDVPLWSVPQLGKILHQSSYRVFSVGLNPALAALEQRPPKIESQRLFPQGDVVFITDEVFLDYPQKALQVIEAIKEMNKSKPIGALRCKVAARPGVRTWLMNLAIERTRDRPHSPWLTLFETISDLSPPEKDDKFNPGNPSEDADLVSIAPEQLPTFQELDKTDQIRALDYAVNWFAGWSYMHASEFRRFSVCHMPQTMLGQKSSAGSDADPRGWADEYKYLVVETPDQWLQRQQDKKDRKKLSW